MQPESGTRRKEPRYPVETPALIERGSGEIVAAATVNVSGSGVLLELQPPPDLNLGEEVHCGIELYPGKPPQPWGVGKVVRVDKSRVALEFGESTAPHINAHESP